MEIEWTDTDPGTGERRYICAEKFARKWRFKVRNHRRRPWDRNVLLTRELWETLLESMERRYVRREGITDEDLAAVRHIIAGMKPAEIVPEPE
jgi:hypothetical protein